MTKQEYLMGNEAMGRGAIEAGAKVVAGYPGTPASEVLEYTLTSMPSGVSTKRWL